MFFPLTFKTEYSLLTSMIKIKDLITFLKKHNITACGIIDNNLFYVMDFYNSCLENNIKPIIGLEIEINNFPIYLYAKNYEGYKNLLKLNTIIQTRAITLKDLEDYYLNLKIVIPYKSSPLYQDLAFTSPYIMYKNDYEKKNGLLLTKNIVYSNVIKCLELEDTKYLDYLDMIRLGKNINDYEKISHEEDYFIIPDEIAKQTTVSFIEDINFTIPTQGKYIPKYDSNIKDSFSYLGALCKKGLEKRLNHEVASKYQERLIYELDVINKMGFVDYFLIVYDYVKYAKQNNIMVGPGRGSAAGSLVSYSLGITEVDPLEYGLLFERFLNPERITMPDIDIDFEDTRRDEVIEYVKSRYGKDKVSLIMTYGTLGSRQVIKDVARTLDININIIDTATKMINPHLSLKENLENPKLVAYLKANQLTNIYKIALKLEGLKRHISTHAAGVVISSETLDNLIPIYVMDNNIATGITMNYLESLGLLKMDFLSIANLTVIHNVLDLIKKNLNINLDLKNIPLDDPLVYNLFSSGETSGIFQYESAGMINFLKKLKPKTFFDLYAAVALFRPGPMENIDTFIRRKEHKEPITYINSKLEPILKETYGIIVYQEQIMQILSKLANYSYAEADNIRRAMSKKKKEIMTSEKDNFIKRAAKNHIKEEEAKEIYDLILKFANYGFNKSHSVCYALIGYQMAYLKVHYKEYFITNLLNMTIGSEIKTKEYITMLKRNDLIILKPDINLSEDKYLIDGKTIRLPLSAIKGVGNSGCLSILKEREQKKFSDFFDFVARCYGKSINKKTILSLIYAGCFSSFNLNYHTLVNNLDNAIRYAELYSDLDESLVMKPVIEEVPEYSNNELMKYEEEVLGFFLTNHPSSTYQHGIVKIKNISSYLSKYVKCVVLINKIKTLQTKNNETMAFISASDEEGMLDFIVFPKYNKLLNNIKTDDLVMIIGKVEKRLNKYQVNVTNIERL